MDFLVSAGEASGDMYASGVVAHLSRRYPEAHFYGCAGPRLQAAGVEPVIDSASLAVVGLAEVVSHLPRIYGEFRKLVHFAERRRPDAALLTDSPDFHLRVAQHLKRLDVPVFYLVAPQVWAWRQGRVKTIAKLVDKLYCLFPFEERWFRERGVDATYIGHPLAHTVRTSMTREEFFESHALPKDRQLIVLLPGSRAGEARRHMPDLIQAVRQLRGRFPLSVILATPKGFRTGAALEKFREPMAAQSIKIVENETWDCIGHADLALAASGTVTIEAAVLGTPMVTFYKVMPLSWYAGRHLVKAPFLSMANLVADRKIVPELIQHEMTSDNIAAAASNLLDGSAAARRMKKDLAAVRESLTLEGDPFLRVANSIADTYPRLHPGEPVSSLSGRQ
ncbi:MAG: lipid-A-disaccharide synthase [Acidobacteriota bacterium]|nr:lipid-A-disaccharide synthase [Acidobacteriota bacterium]